MKERSSLFSSLSNGFLSKERFGEVMGQTTVICIILMNNDHDMDQEAVQLYTWL